MQHTSFIEVDNPQEKVVKIADSEHFIILSNAAEVLREIDKFLGNLP